jgi:hypothetical protein
LWQRFWPPRCTSYGPQKPIIDPAPAQVRSQFSPNLDIGWVGIPVQEGFGGNDHAWCAKTTLDGALLNESCL